MRAHQPRRSGEAAPGRDLQHHSGSAAQDQEGRDADNVQGRSRRVRVAAREGLGAGRRAGGKERLKHTLGYIEQLSQLPVDANGTTVRTPSDVCRTAKAVRSESPPTQAIWDRTQGTPLSIERQARGIHRRHSGRFDADESLVSVDCVDHRRSLGVGVPGARLRPLARYLRSPPTRSKGRGGSSSRRWHSR
eukprot:scaffold48_cov311-Pinguiococcus_pyrenoidosus.AAC.193